MPKLENTHLSLLVVGVLNHLHRVKRVTVSKKSKKFFLMIVSRSSHTILGVGCS